MTNLLVRGQGVFVFETKTNFYLYNEDNTDGLYICNDNGFTTVQRINFNEKLVDKQETITWFSLDSYNQCIYGGNGEVRIETSIYTYTYDLNFIEERYNMIRFISGQAGLVYAR